MAFREQKIILSVQKQRGSPKKNCIFVLYIFMIEDLEFLTLEYRQDLTILFARWLTEVNSEQLRLGYTQILEIGDPEKIHLWLIDTRRRGPTSPEGVNWFFQTYLPKLQACLKQKHFMAILHTPSYFIYLRDIIGFDKLTAYTKDTLLILDFFDSEQSAVEWLRANA